MVVGTTSHAGKSLLTAVLCRLLSRQGHRVAPFKGQNMALNAYVTQSGHEMGYAQAVQAWAAGVDPQVEMNPILLKPQGDMTSQVILQGEAVGRVNAAHYYRDYFDRGWGAITQSLYRLQQTYDWIVCEGAGSPAEINLKHRDLTNMRVAQHLNAATILVADIDRGGVFAHIVGTLQLLDPEERSLIKGFVINKFRGQRSLLESGLNWLEEHTQIPVIGVIPYLSQAFSAEDSLSLFERRSSQSRSELTIAVVRFSRIANFTDFEPLEAEPGIDLRYVQPGQFLGQPDAVILPGSKTTLADLQDLHHSGLAAQIQAYSAAGGMVFGICGGLQMLGDQVTDPEGLEGSIPQIPGLGLLPLTTQMHSEKVTCQREVQAQEFPQSWGWSMPPDRSVRGYEIHQGRTHLTQDEAVVALFCDGSLGWASRDRRVLGTYLHGVFNNGPWRRSWLNLLRTAKGFPPLPTDIPDYEQQRHQHLDAITDAIAPHLDLEPILAKAMALARGTGVEPQRKLPKPMGNPQ
ncbi:cobyric acid synthase [Lyngbya confervoides]|uniref:Cobyric acid synthase n=1 Tax=Lyngbya confervoides BDU141951 TaxID=1574623 RepID=A0ABD4T887_9CYAN|nr:cobyric acid synthase [Lyngbya confervoides]MCM1984802.1 cobyric acid synthase [Lyngbya confervoides BDU141951]